MDESQIPLLTIAVSLLVVLIGGLCKSANIRQKILDNWLNRIKVNESLLDEMAIGILYGLHQKVDRHLGEGDELRQDLPPLNPADFKESSMTFNQILTHKDQMNKNFKRLLSAGTAVILTFVSWIVLVLFAAMYIFVLPDLYIFSVIVYALAGVSVLLICVTLSCYLILQHKLQNIDIFCARSNHAS